MIRGLVFNCFVIFLSAFSLHKLVVHFSSLNGYRSFESLKNLQKHSGSADLVRTSRHEKLFCTVLYCTVLYCTFIDGRFSVLMTLPRTQCTQCLHVLGLVISNLVLAYFSLLFVIATHFCVNKRHFKTQMKQVPVGTMMRP